MNFSKEHLHWLADIVAAIVVVSLLAFIGLALIGAWGASLSTIGSTWFGLYSFIVVMSATKLYGKKVYEAVKGAGKGVIQMSGEKK